MEAEETAYGEWDDKRRSRDTFHGVICLHRVRPAILTSLSLTKPTSLISEAMVGVGGGGGVISGGPFESKPREVQPMDW